MKIVVMTLACCVAALLALGMVMLYSSSMSQVGAHYLMMQLMWCVLGLGAWVTMASLDYRSLKKFAWPLFAVAVCLLVLVLVPLPHGYTKPINGARRWFSLPGMRLQPSEFAKLALILVLAWYCDYSQRRMQTFVRGILLPGAIIGLVLGLIFIEPDVGNALLLASVSSVMLLVSGIRLKYFLPPCLALAVAVGVFIYHNPMRSQRIYSWLHVEETKRDKGLQAYQAMVALGSGGWFGEGLGDSRQKLGFIPEHHTDFILPIIGEELGLAATLSVLLAFVLILACGVYIARRARDPFGQLLAVGVTFLIALQALINIGVVTSALPNKGLPLPFISYGGSNLLAMLTCVGLLWSVARQANASESSRRGAFDASELPQSA